MTQFASDTFTGTNGDGIYAQAMVLGGPWVQGGGSSGSPVYNSNRAREGWAGVSLAAQMYATATPASPDYSVSVSLITQSGGSDSASGVIGRKTADTVGTFYLADYYDAVASGSRIFRLYKCVSGTFTQLGTSPYTQNLGASATVTLKLEMIGTAIKVYVDGVERISATDSSITAAGRAGIRMSNSTNASTNALFIDNFSADTIDQTITVGTASETDTAGAAGVLSDQTISVGTASETDTAAVVDPIFGGTGFLYDTFTDTDSVAITSHSGETPVTWTAHPLWAASGLITYANRILRNNLTDQVALASVTPPGADYAASCVLRGIAAPASTGVAKGIGIRADSSASTFYWADYVDAATPQVRLFKCVAGSFTSLGTYNVSLAAGQNMIVTLEAIGTAIKVYVDGVSRITATDSAVTATGKVIVTCSAGLPADTGATGFHLSAVNAYVPDLSQTVSVGTASETDTAVALTAVFDQTISVGTASETDSPGGVSVESVSGTRAQGGMALLFRSRSAPVSQTITVGTATETDTAFSVTIPADQTITVGTATETDSPGVVSVASPQTISVGTAEETDTAVAVTIVLPGTIIVHPQGMVPGTSIGAYLRWEWKGPVAAKLNAGPGSAVETTTVADDLTATFTLPAGEYVAYASAYPTKRLFFMVTE